MCGIVGYIGPKSVVPVIIEGLRRLEYRGYDSAGIAVGGAPEAPDALALRRAPGKLKNLEAVLAADPLHGTYGIGHTRWATHGRPTEENAHPHRDGTGTLVVVHNGIVENYLSLKQHLIAKGHTFQSETDTEIIAHLIQDSTLARAPRRRHTPGCPRTLCTGFPRQTSPAEAAPPPPLTSAAHTPTATPPRMKPSAAPSSASPAPSPSASSPPTRPDTLVAARMGPPAVLGIGEGEFFLASDVPGILHHTRNIHFLADGEVATLTKTGITLTDFDGHPSSP